MSAYETRSKPTLPDYAYQEEGIEFLKTHPRALLADEPGLGKTRELLLAAQPPVLVVAPAMVLDSGVWQNEHKKWAPDLDLRSVSYSSLCVREKTGKGSGTKPLPIPRPEYKNQQWGTVILDEAHYIKGRKVSWSLAVGKLKTDRLWMATGTPIPNYAYDLWGLLRYLYPKDRRFSSWIRWRDTWFKTFNPPYGGTQIAGLLECNRACKGSDTCEHWAEFYRENLGDVFLQRLRDDVLGDLPPLTEVEVECPMTAKQARVYKQLKKDFITWVYGNEIKAWSESGKLTKLAKLGTGVAIELPQDKPDYAGSGKLSMLRELLEQRHGLPTLVVAHYKATCDQIERVCTDLKLPYGVLTGDTPKAQRHTVVEGFQGGEFPVLVASSVISEGLTLTRADTVIKLERSWRPSVNEQINRRVHRIGQERPVTVYSLTTPGTLDQNMTKILANKTDQQVKALRSGDFVELI